MKNKLFLVAILLGLVSVFSATAQSVKKGDVAPSFSLEKTDGTTVTNETYKGKALLLHFWATWCPPCRTELPEMNTLSKKLNANSKLAFLAVCISDERATMNAFLKQNKYTFDCGLEANDSISSAYGVQAIPTSILISPDGKILKVRTGAMTKSMLESFIADVM